MAYDNNKPIEKITISTNPTIIFERINQLIDKVEGLGSKSGHGGIHISPKLKQTVAEQKATSLAPQGGIRSTWDAVIEEMKTETDDTNLPQPVKDADRVPQPKIVDNRPHCTSGCGHYCESINEPDFCNSDEGDLCVPALLATIEQQTTCLQKIATTIGSVSKGDSDDLELLPKEVGRIINDLNKQVNHWSNETVETIYADLATTKDRLIDELNVSAGLRLKLEKAEQFVANLNSEIEQWDINTKLITEQRNTALQQVDELKGEVRDYARRVESAEAAYDVTLKQVEELKKDYKKMMYERNELITANATMIADVERYITANDLSINGALARNVSKWIKCNWDIHNKGIQAEEPKPADVVDWEGKYDTVIKELEQIKNHIVDRKPTWDRSFDLVNNLLNQQAGFDPSNVSEDGNTYNHPNGVEPSEIKLDVNEVADTSSRQAVRLAVVSSATRSVVPETAVKRH